MTKIVRPADNVEPVERSSALGLEKVTTQEDIAQVAAQLAELTQTVEAMAKDLKAMTERADTQEARSDTQEARSDTQEARSDTQEARSDTQEARSDNWRAIADIQDDDALMQQERVDLAARELADVSRRLQAAATLLQDSGDSGSRISGKRSFAE
jgi:chromosome segregation ATPase